MQVNPIYAHIGQRNQNGTQNLSLYNPKTQTYQTMSASPKEVDEYVTKTNTKRTKVNAAATVSSFIAGVEIAAFMNKLVKSQNRKNLIISGALFASICLISGFGDSFVYNSENEKFIQMKDAMKAVEAANEFI